MADPIDQLCELIAGKLRDEPAASQVALVAHVEGAIAKYPELAAALKADRRMLQVNRDGSSGYQTLVKGGVANIGTHYHLTEPEKFEAVFAAVLQKLQTPAAKVINFEPYLQSVIDDEEYLDWQDVYTPTTVEGQKPSPQVRGSRRLKLRVEAGKSPKEEQSEASEQGASEQKDRVEQLDVLEGLRKYAADHVLLMGKPGSGKSTSLISLLWKVASDALENPAAKIPVLVKLRRCTSSIEALIQDSCSRHRLQLSISELEQLLQQGKLLLLLDGLNELPEACRTEIANFRDRYRTTTPMIVSTRELSVGGTLGIDKTLTMLPLTEPQMQEFVRGYLREAGNQLLQQLKGDRLPKFAETPLLLWMLCRVFAENGRVHANLGLAFREFTHLYDEDIQRDVPAEARQRWPKLLRNLAFALMHDKQPVEFRVSMPREEAEQLLTDVLQQEGRANASCMCQEISYVHWTRRLLSS